MGMRKDTAEDIHLLASLEVDGVSMAQDVVHLNVIRDEYGGFCKWAQEDLRYGRPVFSGLLKKPRPHAFSILLPLAQLGQITHQLLRCISIIWYAGQRSGIRSLNHQVQSCKEEDRQCGGS